MLLDVHTQGYLDSVNSSPAQIASVGLPRPQLECWRCHGFQGRSLVLLSLERMQCRYASWELWACCQMQWCRGISTGL